MSSFWTGRSTRLATRVTLLGVLVALLPLAWAPTSRAQPARRASSAPSEAGPASPPAPTSALAFDTSESSNLDEGARTRARSLYDQGVRAYGENRYYQAAELFLDAHRIYPTPQLLFNVAKAYDKLGVPARALAFYREYLRGLPNAPDASEVASRVRELEAALSQRGMQQFTVLTDPPRAVLAVDGMPVGVTPWTGETWPGVHRLTVTLDGHQSLVTLITLEGLRAQEFTFDLVPVPAAKTERPCAPAPTARPPGVSPLTWIVLGTATAALGTTLIVEMAQKNASGLTSTGAFFGGIGIATSVIGGVLLHLDLQEPEVAPMQKQRAYVAGISGRF